MLGATTCKLSLRDKLDQPLQTVEVNRAELNQLQAGFGIMLQNLLPIRIPGFQIDARNAFDACVLVRYVSRCGMLFVMSALYPAHWVHMHVPVNSASAWFIRLFASDSNV